MQTRERFNGGFRSDAATVFSPSDELGTRNESNLCARSIRLIHSFSLFFLSHLPWIHIYPRIIRPFVLNACMFSDPDTHREIAAGGVRDVTWHGRHACTLVDARTHGRIGKNGWARQMEYSKNVNGSSPGFRTTRRFLRVLILPFSCRLQRTVLTLFTRRRRIAFLPHFIQKIDSSIYIESIYVYMYVYYVW